MEWMNRGARPATVNQAAPAQGVPAPGPSQGKKPGKWKPMKIATIALVFFGSLLIVGSLAAVALTLRSNSQAKSVDSANMQAVFLNGGQVYFGNIKQLDSEYLKLDNIYYLRVNQQVQPNGQSATNQDISLVKLGCELHGPQDSMIINQSQVIFWENLKADGQVAKAVADYVKQNPDGQKCDTASSSSSTNSTPATTNSSTTNTSTTNKTN